MKYFMVALAAIVFLVACGSNDPPPPVLRVAMFGDSTLWGAPSYRPPWQGSRIDVTIPQEMERLGGMVVYNGGRNGARPSDLLIGADGDGTDYGYPDQGSHPPFSDWLKESNHDVIVFAYGAASAVRSDNNFEKSMIDLINLALLAGKRVVLQEPTPVLSLPGFVAIESQIRNEENIRIIRSLSKSYGLLIIPVRSISYSVADDLWDGLHPEQNFALRIANLAHRTILEIK